MSESEQPREVDAASQGDGEDDDYAPTPFDNPFFLPVLLIGFSLWFIYDGWFNPEMEWIKFNRIGAVIFAGLAVWFTSKAIRERRARSESNTEEG